jgi:hypothetical protein
MPSVYENLRTDRQYSSSTGLTQAKFDELHSVFATFYVPQKTNPLTGVPPRCFGLSDFSVRDNYDYILPFLKQSLAMSTGIIPRLFESDQAFQLAFSQVEEINLCPIMEF